MLVKDVLQLCDKNMNISIVMSNEVTEQVVSSFLNANGIYNVRPRDLIDSDIDNTSIMDIEASGTDEEKILKEAAMIVKPSWISDLNRFLRFGGTFDCFNGLEVDFFTQNHQGFFEINIK